ncbi:Panacea domain-containing protein [Candidatus Phytoplasma australiense]|uniref:Phage-Associated Protein n=1 Tax=Strawberry lethal yellows phytoplasma (CPA) str. NZSb11 TaxID=980422 RepID=R4RNE6_PHYAS|nr:type II toxin-antitoxin system antitoxin SocA domain-containing protein [Candidatus Phytoplasma australiense]AGL90905.1 Phage-Associated Protein [Strawberry lethal yellows phytoplasma (CPA) str. NZSb11]
MKNNNQINVFDVANYIIENNPHKTTHMKLHKMIYYAYAKYLMKHNSLPNFKDSFRAWVYGPVLPELYNEFKEFTYLPINKLSPKGNSTKINSTLKKNIDFIIELYGAKTGNELADLTHQELPWELSYNGNITWDKNVILDQTIYDFFKNNLNRIQK